MTALALVLKLTAPLLARSGGVELKSGGLTVSVSGSGLSYSVAVDGGAGSRPVYKQGGAHAFTA